jgi:hypothetical protein
LGILIPQKRVRKYPQQAYANVYANAAMIAAIKNIIVIFLKEHMTVI